MTKNFRHLVSSYKFPFPRILAAACGQPFPFKVLICPINFDRATIDCEECKKTKEYRDSLVRFYLVFNSCRFFYISGTHEKYSLRQRRDNSE